MDQSLPTVPVLPTDVDADDPRPVSI